MTGNIYLLTLLTYFLLHWHARSFCFKFVLSLLFKNVFKRLRAATVHILPSSITNSFLRAVPVLADTSVGSSH
jgi:hypothetical protein